MAKPGTWPKGVSGNPNGKPRGPIVELARENSEHAMRRIIQLVDSPDDRVALAASEAVLNRAWGKPAQAIEVADNRVQDVVSIDLRELARQIAFVLTAAARSPLIEASNSTKQE